MTKESNNNGRAFEYICLITLEQRISQYRPVKITKTSSYDAAKKAWDLIGSDSQNNLIKSADAAVTTIFDLEPLILEDGDDMLELLLQLDEEGKKGDVRDILLIRRDILWEIGLSLKHNHFAVKHSRLGKKLDFGKEWFGIPCSNDYWNSVTPIFDKLSAYKGEGVEWNQLPDKEEAVYVPILNAFLEETKRRCAQNEDVPKKMVEYLLGEYDFYKVIGIDTKHETMIQAFNLRGTLNNSHDKKAAINLPITSLPSRLVCMEYKPQSKTTVEMYLDGGWQFSFRIHNASTIVEPSLKFDIQIIGMPATIITINSKWR